ncbi:D-erythronate dehydrogenase [Bartonella tamiae]|uniref:3-beta hydroxysteroid dehydrogenase/isomerase domain-containing protein n=1 Tax=Bartonella tamiae Th239 TaxID=1094558 RepID=J0R176_9HYPH|nr:D-erythronate dehydrogenase [Bartonella tamiae]EJF89299.1 hypothetical protein ME5_01850 [Bartonella tamiae Th239]EJF95539.1 hypothetical protein MEG_00029 [Bartonella tamiae Th307]
MKKIVVTGGAGFLGSRLIATLLSVKGHQGYPEFDQIISVDLAPCPLNDNRIVSMTGDIADEKFSQQVITSGTVAIYHMAAVLSGQSEDDFDMGMRVNIDGTRMLLEAARHTKEVPIFIFTSSLAVFGGDMPDIVPEDLALLPQSSYGAQKAIGEILVGDYTRKGFIDGRVCRLPTIVVRPGKPNSAASSFASGIIREPLSAIRSNNPVPENTRMWLSSPNIAVKNLAHALVVKSEKIGSNRVLNLPGLCVSVAEMLDSLERIAGKQTRDLVSANPEQRVVDIVCSWPGNFDVKRPLALGFSYDSDFDSIIIQYRDEFVSNI